MALLIDTFDLVYSGVALYAYIRWAGLHLDWWQFDSKEKRWVYGE